MVQTTATRRAEGSKAEHNSKKKTNNPREKWVQDKNRQFIQRDSTKVHTKWLYQR
jgi:hypothetical protein